MTVACWSDPGSRSKRRSHRVPEDRRRRAATTGLAILLGAVTPAQQAQAHGAPWNPISRGAACAPDNERYGDSPACKAAQAASAGVALDAWDNMRRKDVQGRHRSVVPDGELCSAGLDQYRGLNLPRTDWPVTIVNEGAVRMILWSGHPDNGS